MQEIPRTHAVNWFEIPVQDMERAQRFYETLLAAPLKREQVGAYTLAVFPAAGGGVGVGGCLLAGGDAPPPAQTGTVVYLNAEPSLDTVLARVEAAGGRIAMPRIDLPGELGCCAHVLDPEGNRVGLHALA
ncbi:VOC family protein [Aquabacterium sp. A7-Y]|uniref:VOC family protein n=1 Tax=Aquabacterium sp. A7-Y TaxID=1349605 RepID=UPI00223CE965|nr:VOC family protein [Aquabacterium sp. A7-Y]MCW7540059.1 VOC family protein [Aquabacterium sp. A7-Y]